MDNIKLIQQKFLDQAYKTNPVMCAEDLAILTAEYARMSESMEGIMALKPQKWLELRESKNSDSSTDKEFTRTELGQNESRLKLRMKSTEMMMRSLKTLLRAYENEQYNNH